MKAPFLILIASLIFSTAYAQVSFSDVDSKIKAIKSDNSTEITCESSTMSANFQLKRDVTLTQQDKFLNVDGQIVQITPLKFIGNKSDNLSVDDQKKLLNTYSQYELAYFKDKLKIEIVNPGDQWVVNKSKGWVVWYFKVGGVPVQAVKKTHIQLFASTIIGDKVLTINAHILSDADEAFTKAGLIVNDIMKTLNIVKQ